ncbi:MAG TPA: 23S rRNA (adenine(2030)-N(6))-methyltransferase RlmJ [Stenotrophobium sp.]|jgi:23S rRNA (adenine2030-N6)-methyltransferase|nr:23S rRNA (adenine(2030)-N(6))-methyltransferase RlmJ [Stenotrophobium sp.]
MHYRHSYHAGNFADVFKHVMLCGLAAALNRKDKPWCYVDTHAGAGLYDLGGESATRTSEWEEGIGRLRGFGEVAEPLATYLRLVRATNPDDRLRHYPGSPLLVQGLARAGDRLLLCEKMPEVADDLKIVLGRDARVAVHVRDGYESHALLPPAEKRGLMLVDPPFERGDELDAMAELSLKSLARFAGGVQALWYPVKNRHVVSGFLRRMGRESTRPALNFEFDTGAPREAEVSASGITKHPLRGCGLLVVNPPFRLAQEMEPSLRLIARTLAQGPDAHCTATWIRPE